MLSMAQNGIAVLWLLRRHEHQAKIMYQLFLLDWWFWCSLILF